MAHDLGTCVLALERMKRDREAELAAIERALQSLREEQREKNRAAWAAHGVNLEASE